VILILSNKNDPHVPFVTGHLHSAYSIIDPVAFTHDDSLDYVFEHGSLGVRYRHKPLGSVKSVWYRRPSSGSTAASLSEVADAQKAYSASAIDRHAQAINYLFENASWVSNFQAIRTANCKPLQLQRAVAAGFAVPDTLFASNATQAVSFIKKHKICIAKPQAAVFPEGMVAYAKLIRDGEQHNFSGLRYDPYIFQQFIDPKCEYRVTVVGNKAFTATLRNSQEQAGSSYRDWRTGNSDDNLVIKPANIPGRLQAACIKLTKSFGLEHSAIDLIEDKNGKIWFLEINPNGQWAFVEQATQLPIGAAIARLLESRP
jgi:glutathione synthase/RimK-type ligase-like ATP-grasp enzyme